MTKRTLPPPVCKRCGDEWELPAVKSGSRNPLCPTCRQAYKWCPKCETIKPHADFYRATATKSFLRSSCKRCVIDARLTSYQADPERWLSYRLKHEYGITLSEWDELFRKQGGVCALCQRECSTGRRLCVDHDHVTGQVRGLLCHDCNTGIGKLQDDPELLVKAAGYVARFRKGA